MATPPGNKPSLIFKSLQADRPASAASGSTASASTPAAPVSPAAEAQQRWPLFKAVAPVHPAATPPMTDEDRQNWQRPAHVELPDPQRTSTVQSFNDKLAAGLCRLATAHPVNPPDDSTKTDSRHAADVPPPAPVPAAPPVPESDLSSTVSPLRPPVLADPPPPPQPQPADPAPATSAIPAAGPASSPEPEPAPADRPPAHRGFPSIRSAITMDYTPPAATGLPQNPPESLQHLFHRLANPIAPVARPVNKKSSFLSRLGKR